jgi:hypothetical protein
MSSPAETTRGYEEIADWTKSVVGATLILNRYNGKRKDHLLPLSSTRSVACLFDGLSRLVGEK